MKAVTLKQMIQVANAYLDAGEVVCKALKTYINDPRISHAVLVFDKAVRESAETMIDKHGEELGAAFKKVEEAIENLNNKEEKEETTH